MASKKDMRSFIVLRAGARPRHEVVQIDLNNFNEGVYKALNVNIYEHVHIGPTCGVDLHMLVDEGGAINCSKLNRAATYLYGHRIFGDALLCTVTDYDIAPIEGSDFFKLQRLFIR